MNGIVALCPNPYRDIGFEITKKAADMLVKAGIQPLISPAFPSRDMPGGLETVPLREAGEKAELMVPIGGDGTLLAVARSVLGKEIPVIGINTGTKGFMIALEPGQLPQLVDAAKGRYAPQRRMMLDVELRRGGETVFSDCALNDAVIHGIMDCIQMEIQSDGQSIIRYAGDGVVAATPTGSTAYSMSAGGPLVEPEAEAVILTPICAHDMRARSFVLSPGRTVTVVTKGLRERRAVLSVDGGKGFELCSRDELTVKRSKNVTIFASVDDRSFYQTAYSKLAGKTGP